MTTAHRTDGRTCVLNHRLRPTRMVRQESGDIVDDAVNGDPAIALRIVLRELRRGDFTVRDSGRGGGGWRGGGGHPCCHKEWKGAGSEAPDSEIFFFCASHPRPAGKATRPRRFRPSGL